jgi:hypothetical protein
VTRSTLNTSVAVAAAGMLIVGSTLIEGFTCGRWRSTSPAASTALTSLRLSTSLDAWACEAGPVAQVTAPPAVAWTFRRARPQHTAHLFLVAGDRRALAAHRPESCFAQTSLRVEGPPVALRVAAGSLQTEVWTATFWRETPEGRRRLRAYWTTLVGGNWTTIAPGRPGPTPYRLYGFTEEPAAQPAEGEHLLELIRDILPELNELLAADAPTTRLESQPWN